MVLRQFGKILVRVDDLSPEERTLLEESNRSKKQKKALEVLGNRQEAKEGALPPHAKHFQGLYGKVIITDFFCLSTIGDVDNLSGQFPRFF